jgi:uncharacterized DUF497 family protein
MRFDGFDWDSGNRDKCQTHGVTIAEIERLFDGVVLVGPDDAHSDTERRFRAIGTTIGGRHVFLVFTWRTKNGRQFLRPISARYMHRKEVKSHEKEIP